MSNTKTLTESDLRQFTGTETWYRHSLNRKVVYTEGVQYFAERGGAYWLIDEISLIQPYDKKAAAEEFQVWTLIVRADRTATLACEEGNGNVVFTKELEFTEFPLDVIKLWFTDNTLLLPSEY